VTHTPAALWRRFRAIPTRGQALIETSLFLGILLFLVVGTLEFGFVFDHHITLEYATREGARTGASLANGGGPLGCGAGQSPKAATVDPQIIAAVERVVTASGSDVDLDQISQIRIFAAGTDGQELGPVNIWTYAAGAGPVVDGKALDFKAGAQSWAACSRTNGGNPDSVGVSLTYTYRLRTAASALFGWATIGMNDRTVMQLNPTAP
jgi:chitodextrinase